MHKKAKIIVYRTVSADPSYFYKLDLGNDTLYYYLSKKHLIIYDNIDWIVSYTKFSDKDLHKEYEVKVTVRNNKIKMTWWEIFCSFNSSEPRWWGGRRGRF